MALGAVSTAGFWVKEAQRLMRRVFTLVVKTEFLARLTNTTLLRVVRQILLPYHGALSVRQTFSRNLEILKQRLFKLIRCEKLLKGIENAPPGILGENLQVLKSTLRNL